MRLPSCDQRGRAAYPLRYVIFLGSEPSAFTIQSCRWSFSPAEKNASVLESGDQAGSKSGLCPVVAMLTIAAGVLPDVPRTSVCFDGVDAVACTHATCLPSASRTIS